MRQSDKSPIGPELPIRFASFQKKLGLNLPEIYGKVMEQVGDSKVQPLEAAVRVLQKLGIQVGYLAEDEPCCGAPLYNAGLHQEFANNDRQASQKMKSFGVKRIISIVPYCTHALL